LGAAQIGLLRRATDRADGRVGAGRSGSGGLGEDAFEATEVDQIVGGAHEIAREGGAVEPSEAGPAEAADGLHSAEDLLDPLADAPADGIVGMARGPAVDGAPATAGVLGHVECPTGSGQYLTLNEIAMELSRRRSGIFLRDARERRAVFGEHALFQDDPY
jgi:hypothetical protein